MQFQLVGYFPKTSAVPPGWHFADHVTELCSVSTCAAPAPEGWIDRWLHNDVGLFNSIRDAQACIPPESTTFHIFAYRLFTERFDDGAAESIVLPALPVEPLPPDFVSLGFDIVTKDLSDFFECSPLSCNGMAAEALVNAYCLLDDPQRAVALAIEYSRAGNVEPGYYHVIEVLRSAVPRPSAAA
jgi:hypothetical protein